MYKSLSEALSSESPKWRSSYVRFGGNDNNAPKRLIYLTEQELVDRIRLSGLIVPEELNKLILDEHLTGLALRFTSDDLLRNLVKNDTFAMILMGIRSVLLKIEEKEELRAIKIEEKEELRAIKMEAKLEQEEKMLKAKRTVKYVLNVNAINGVEPLLFGMVSLSSQSQYDSFLNKRNFKCLMNTTDNYVTHEYYNYLELSDGLVYYPLKAVSESNIDPEKELLAIRNAVRSRADTSIMRKLSDRIGTRLDFVANEFQLVNVNGTTVGDVDTLLKDEDTFYIIERKRTVGEEIFEQVNRTHIAFEDFLRRNGTTQMRVKSVVYSESIRPEYSKKLLELGILVFADAVEEL